MPCHHQILPLKMTPCLLGRISIRRRSFSWSRIWKISLNLFFHLLKTCFGSVLVFLRSEMGWIITHHKFSTTGRSGIFFTVFPLFKGGFELTYRPKPLPFSQNFSLPPGESSGRAGQSHRGWDKTWELPQTGPEQHIQTYFCPNDPGAHGVAHFSKVFPIYAPIHW